MRSVGGCQPTGRFCTREVGAKVRDFLQGNRRGKLIDWLKIDSWIDSGLYNSWIGFRDWWAGYSSFFGRFEVKGAVRALNELACEGLTLSVGGLLVGDEDTLSAGVTADFRSTSTTNTGVIVELYQDAGSSAADDDDHALIKFYGNNDNGTPEKIEYARVSSRSIDVSDGAEKGQLDFQAALNGTLTSVFKMGYNTSGQAVLAWFNDTLANNFKTIVDWMADVRSFMRRFGLMA